jgi:hypothetical protein
LLNLKPLIYLYEINLWYDVRIAAGFYWNEVIKAEVRNSQIFVVLTTNAYLGSDYIMLQELPAILEMQRRNRALVIPVIYQKCSWRPFFGDRIQATPKNERRELQPVLNWTRPADALAEVTDAIASSIEKWFQVSPSPNFVPD